MPEKECKSYRQQLNLLRSRGMSIGKGTQGSRVIRILERENYYNIINGYKDLFLAVHGTATVQEMYKPGTTFDEVYALYNFDRNIRVIYLRYLLKVEHSFKTVISHEFSSKYGHKNYLRTENFDNSTETNIRAAIKLIGDIQQEIARQMKNGHHVVIHYMTDHGYIPLWVLVNVLTFGKIEYFYNALKPVDKQQISRQFGLTPEVLYTFLDNLDIARNKCAHDERFFDIKFKKAIHTRSIKRFSSLQLTRQPDGSYLHGINDAYSIAIMLSLLLSKTDVKEFVSAMKNEFSKLAKQLNTITVNDVMEIMGFDSTHWMSLTTLERNNK